MCVNVLSCRQGFESQLIQVNVLLWSHVESAEKKWKQKRRIAKIFWIIDEVKLLVIKSAQNVINYKVLSVFYLMKF